MNVLPRGTFSGAGTPTVEELKTYTVQLGDLSQEANVVHAQVKMTCPKHCKKTPGILDIGHCLDTGKEPVIIVLQMAFLQWAFVLGMNYNVEIGWGFREFQVSTVILLLPGSKGLLVWVKILKLYRARSLCMISVNLQDWSWQDKLVVLTPEIRDL